MILINLYILGPYNKGLYANIRLAIRACLFVI